MAEEFYAESQQNFYSCALTTICGYRRERESGS